MSKYCIKDATSMDIIANNLTADEAAELCSFYEDFLGEGSVFMTASPYAMAQDYKHEFINYFAELQEMGNLI